MEKETSGTVDLVERAMGNSAELVRLELALAREEIRHDLVAAKVGASLGAAAVALGLLGLASLCVAFGVALGPLGALVLGGALLVAATVLAVLAAKKFPMKPLEATTRRLEDDGQLLKEHLS
jgi:Putative Actinobacterial Holin-X, holin superfamily III